MTTARKLFPAALSGLALAACASTSPPRATVADPATANTLDGTYITAVEEATRKAGVRVFWVNPPREKDRKPDEPRP
ncbi:hypothetical protein [Arenimonas sp. MALMAid1274]|uniref:hypothetical protein n=1 Tax=Arenimonas sp. MALMAid1274 TaxID=3411630 RepID=UPI003BA0D2F9